MLKACNHTILIVDDDENILQALKRLLQMLPVSVLTATTGDEALEILQKHSVAIIIADQRMPGLSGVEFLRISRDVSPDAVRILLTGHADLEAIVDAVERGRIMYYFLKPWDDEALLGKLRGIIKNMEKRTNNDTNFKPWQSHMSSIEDTTSAGHNSLDKVPECGDV